MRRTYKKSVDLQETTRKQYDYSCHRTFSLLNLNFEEQIAKDDRIQWALNHVSNASSIDTETISAICRSVHLSQSRFSHLFKEQVGVPLSSYLALLKLRKAYQFLLKNFNITFAAMTAGFNSPSHFSSTSRKFLGITASEIKGQCKIF